MNDDKVDVEEFEIHRCDVVEHRDRFHAEKKLNVVLHRDLMWKHQKMRQHLKVPSSWKLTVMMVMVDGCISFVLAVVSLIDVLLAVVLSWLFQRKVFFEAYLVHVVSHIPKYSQ